MGLDTTHDCFHGSYSYFAMWRKRIAELAGYEMEIVSTGSYEYARAKEIDWDQLTEENFMGQWDEIPGSPLVILLAHSDCEGKIYAHHCAPLVEALEKLLPKFDVPDGDKFTRDMLRSTTEQFIAGLRKADMRKQNVSFH